MKQLIVRALLSFILLSIFVPMQSQAANPVAKTFIYPMRTWNLVTEQGDLLSSGAYHMGVDLGGELGAGAPVYAIGDGVVKEVRERTSFGLVVLIEHTLSDGTKVVSLYGHLKPSDQPVAVGEIVHMGDRVGSLGNSAENGGWTPHLHFGIHKDAYSAVWIYYGHVRSKSTEMYWHDPGRFIADRLTKDRFRPTISAVFSRSSIIGDSLRFTIDAQDLGSLMNTTVVEVSEDAQATWKKVAEYNKSASYPYRVTIALPNMDNGKSYIKITGTDRLGNQTRKVVKLSRNMRMNTAIGGVVLKRRGTGMLAHVIYQSGGIERTLAPQSSRSKESGDVATGDMNGDGSQETVTIRGGNNAMVSVFDSEGIRISRFQAYAYKSQLSARVAAGDVNGDGTDEIIVAYGPGSQKNVRVFSMNGSLLGEFSPFEKTKKEGLDVAVGDVDGDGIDEIITTTRASKTTTVAIVNRLSGERLKKITVLTKKYTKGANVSAGDINGDGKDEIIVGVSAAGGKPGRVIAIPFANPTKGRVVIEPFSRSFYGAIDVASYDSNGDGKDEVLMSQASNGPAIVRLFVMQPKPKAIMTEVYFGIKDKTGARVAGWQ